MKLSRMCLLLAGAMAIAATGCAEKNTPPPGPSQTEVDLRDRLQKAEAELARAMSDRERDANQIAALQAELDRLRKQLAERPPADETACSPRQARLSWWYVVSLTST